jgi:protein-disulfide isomerase
LAYRYFPLKSIHANAVSSAAAAEAAGLQGKFWDMHDLLFEKQGDWENLQSPQEMFAFYAQALGLDVNKFKSDMNSEGVLGKINSAYNDAMQLSLNHTPTIYINGKEVQTPGNYQGFKDLVEQKLHE